MIPCQTHKGRLAELTYRVRESNFLWVARVPEVLGSLDLLGRGLERERWADPGHCCCYDGGGEDGSKASS